MVAQSLYFCYRDAFGLFSDYGLDFIVREMQ